MQNRFAKRTDKSQPGIVKTLRKIGAQIIITNWGDDFPDLLCGFRGAWKLAEVKELGGHFSRGQLLFLAGATAPVDVITTEGDALESLHRNRTVNELEQAQIIGWLRSNPGQETIRVKKLLKLIGRGLSGDKC